MVDEVSHPGQRPEEFDFPFAEARQLIAAIEGLLDEITGVVAARESAASSAFVGFEGQTRAQLEGLLEQTLQSLRRCRGELGGQITELEEAIVAARARREASLQAIAGWESAIAQYREAQRAG